jgi:hypothetical protein
MNAFTILAIGGLSLVMLSYFTGGLCQKALDGGGALCFKGFGTLGKGATDVGEAPGQDNCQFLGNGQVCWFGSDGGQGCINSNKGSSDWKTSSGRDTLCSRARTAYLAAHKSPAATPGTRRHGPHRTGLRPKVSSNFAYGYVAERLSIA